MDLWLEKNESPRESLKMETSVSCPHPCIPNVVLGPAASVSPGSLVGMQTLAVLNPHLPFNKLPRGSRGLLDSKSHQDADFVLFTAVSQHLEPSLMNSRCSVNTQGPNECS